MVNMDDTNIEPTMIPARVDDVPDVDLCGGTVGAAPSPILNAAGKEILGLCDGERSVQDIMDELDDRYPGGTVGNTALAFLKMAHACGLIIMFRPR